MNITDLITLLRETIETLNYNCYSPDLPQNEETCVSISLGQGENQRSISKSILYSDIPFYLLIRGTTNDTETRTIADTIFNVLDHRKNLTKNNTRIILISCDTPNYAFRDENQRIHYNINCKCKIEWSDNNEI